MRYIWLIGILLFSGCATFEYGDYVKREKRLPFQSEWKRRPLVYIKGGAGLYKTDKVEVSKPNPPDKAIINLGGVIRNPNANVGD